VQKRESVKSNTFELTKIDGYISLILFNIHIHIQTHHAVVPFFTLYLVGSSREAYRIAEPHLKSSLVMW